MSSLVAYDVDDSESNSEEDDNQIAVDFKLKQLNSAPLVLAHELDVKEERNKVVDPKAKEINYNPKYENLFAPEFGPSNPSTDASKRNHNFLTGHIEDAHLSEVTFELQRKQFHAYGIADNPSDGAAVDEQIKKVNEN